MEVVLELLGNLWALCPVQFLPAPVQVFEVQGKQYRVLKQIGEGGYAFVYLAKEITTNRPALEPVAVKKIIAGSQEKLSEATREVRVLQVLSHANCLPLLGHAIQPSSSGAGRAQEVLLVFPAYQDGTLLDELDRLALEGRRLTSQDVLDIFQQLCAGAAHVHSRGYAHLDIKPHNVLIRRPTGRQQQRQQQGAAVGPMAPPRPPPLAGWRQAEEEEEEGEDGAGGGGGGAVGDREAGSSLLSRGYQAVLMDFGSARPMPIHVGSRAHALAVQEDAEAHCTATFRAPELFDVSSHCTLTSKVDVWALGCTLYSMMYGASPFQQALDQGASLALAVMNCRLPWPCKPGAARYPQPLHDLVAWCLTVDPERRPSVSQVAQRVADLRTSTSAWPSGGGADTAAAVVVHVP